MGRAPGSFRHEAVKAATAGRSGSGMEPARCCFIPDRPAGHINGPSYRLKNRLAAVDTTDVPPPELPRIPERRLTRRTTLLTYMAPAAPTQPGAGSGDERV